MSALTRPGKWKLIKINSEGKGEPQYLNKAGEGLEDLVKRMEKDGGDKKNYKVEDPPMSLVDLSSLLMIIKNVADLKLIEEIEQKGLKMAVLKQYFVDNLVDWAQENKIK